MSGLLFVNVNDSFVYSGVKFRIVKGMLDVDIGHKLKKLNVTAFNIIMILKIWMK